MAGEELMSAGRAQTVTFTAQWRGYHRGEVDTFIDEVVQTLAHYEDGGSEFSSVKPQDTTGGQGSPVGDVVVPAHVSAAAAAILKEASATALATVEEAEREAGSIVQAAQVRADEMMAAAETEATDRESAAQERASEVVVAAEVEARELLENAQQEHTQLLAKVAQLTSARDELMVQLRQVAAAASAAAAQEDEQTPVPTGEV